MFVKFQFYGMYGLICCNIGMGILHMSYSISAVVACQTEDSSTENVKCNPENSGSLTTLSAIGIATGVIIFSSSIVQIVYLNMKRRLITIAGRPSCCGYGCGSGNCDQAPTTNKQAIGTTDETKNPY